MGLAGFLFSLADVRCEHCQHKFKIQDIQEDEFLHCSACGISKPIAKRGEKKHIDLDKSLVRPSPSVQVQREGSIFIIEKKWVSKFSKFAMTVAALWNVLWISAFWASGKGYFSADLIGLDLLTKEVLVLSGLGLTLWALRASLNRTRIMIKNHKMVVSTSPFHWGSLEVYDINQIEGIRLWTEDPKTGKPTFGFRVEMTLKDGRVVNLCPAMDSNEAAYIEKTLEEILLIEQTPIIVDPLVV